MGVDPSIPTFRPGEPLYADDLNRITRGLRRTRSGPGASVIDSEAGLVVSGSQRGAHPKRTFYARIGASVADGANRWKYAWLEVIKNGTGYGKWIVRTGGRVGLSTNATAARNFREEMNSATGTQGHGININGTGFPAGFSTRPCPPNQIVLMFVVPLADGTDYEYWFDHINSVDGTCT